MKHIQWLLAVFMLSSCGLGGNPSSITIIENGKIQPANSNSSIPKIIFEEAGIIVHSGDAVYVNGIPASLDQPIESDQPVQLQLKRAVTFTINTPDGEQAIQTSAATVGDALHEAGYKINPNDKIIPAENTPIKTSMQVTYVPTQNLTINIGNETYSIRSAAETVGEALAEAGILLTGLDVSLPSENEPLPADGQIHVTRVTEAIDIALEAIPFTVETVTSVDVPFGQDEIVQAGENGTAMVRTRVRYENGIEIDRKAEDTIILREPTKQIVASGSKIVLSPVGGEIPYQYWYATEMYASVYSPCASGIDGCSYGTASGARAGYGIVAVDYSIYSYLAGMQVYIPGYGVGTIGDTGGGPIIETAFGVPRTKWIDLGFDDGKMVNMTGWVTVYFLAPAPAEIPYFLK